jgi:hypothetical protein
MSSASYIRNPTYTDGHRRASVALVNPCWASFWPSWHSQVSARNSMGMRERTFNGSSGTLPPAMSIQAESEEPTSGLEPLTSSHYEIIQRR